MTGPGRSTTTVLADSRSPVLLSARRTAIGTAGHAFGRLPAHQLAAPLLAEAAGIALEAGCLAVDEVVLGNCMGPGGNLARVSALAAGLGTAVPGVTIDRQCGSGLDAVVHAGSRIRAGDAALVLAGGVESASTAPWRFWPPDVGQAGVAESGRRYLRAPFAPDGFPDPDMGPAADALAAKLGMSRARCDDYAARSHQLASAATIGDLFAAEILPVDGFSRDERPRPGMTAERLGRLPTAFGADGVSTAGNSCGVSDGAAVLAVADRSWVTDRAAAQLSVVAAVVIGDDPALPGLGVGGAVRALLGSPRLARHRLSPNDIGAYEITEAFAPVVLAAIDDLGIERNLVCADGGAIGLGHPWGASGAVLLVRLATRMLNPAGPELGVAACAIGGGQAIAVLLEKS